ncbi:MAG: flagellar filament capping protein FliD [Planctomycetaceae bacterium]|jgi:flagellar hook-associated protein 2|nr:flagellar filament capping protein FliD [Phycisphaerales bacterium]MCE2653235.1 flagellar filament capping protein FliD [Planctomycetaceae bacterium]
MSGVTSSVGLFSGINREQIIGQLLALDGRPKTSAQARIRTLQQQQAAILDVNTRLSSLRTAAQKFNTASVFRAATTASSDSNVLTATAQPGAAPGAYQFIVDRLVSTQQVLSRGFGDQNTSGIGATSMTFESRQARLDRDTPLSQLNGGTGVARGRITVTDSAGRIATVDLSRAATINEVIEAVNNNGTARVRMSVSGGGLVVEDQGGGTGSVTVADAAGFTTATSLGIAGSAAAGGRVTGTQIARLGNATALANINDGLGVSLSRAGGLVNPDLRIRSRSGQTFDIDLGDMFEERVPEGSPPGTAARITQVASAVTDIQGVIERINTQARTTAGGPQAVRAQISSDGTRLELVDLTVPSGPGATLQVSEISSSSTTAADLGLLGSTTGGTLTGRRLLAGLGSVLTRNLLGGSGLSGDQLGISTRDGESFSFALDTSGSLTDVINQISSETGGRVRASLDDRGTGLIFTDTSSGGSGFTVTGPGASVLGLTVTGPATLRSANLQMSYVGRATPLSSLNGGRGVQPGAFDLINSYGERRTINLSADNRTVGDVLSQINAQASDIRARINDKGDGILIEEVARTGGAGGQRLSITDVRGTAARDLGIAGTASGTGSSNRIDGSGERTVSFLATDTLQQVAEKINAAGVSATAAVVNDGSGARPFRLSLTARGSGTAGAFILGTGGGFDLGVSTVSEGVDSKVFYGSTDPTRALLFSTSSNTIPGVAPNLALNLKAASPNPVTITVTQDAGAVEDAIDEFISAYNTLLDRINTQTKYDTETNRRSPLTGDSNMLSLRQALTQIINGTPTGVTGRFQNLAQVGVLGTTGGNLRLDGERLRQALQTDPQAVADLFAASTRAQPVTQTPVRDAQGNAIPGVFVTNRTPAGFTVQGIAERVASLADAYVRSSDGVLTRQSRALDQQVTAQNARITSIDARIESRRSRLERQFLRMEETIGRLQGQQGQLGNIRAFTGSVGF